MDDAVELRLDRLVDLRNRVAAGDGGDTAEEVEVLPAGAVVDVLPLAPSELDRFGVVETDAGEEALPVAADQIGRVVRVARLRQASVRSSRSVIGSLLG